jgi:hypothetical protein
MILVTIKMRAGRRAFSEPSNPRAVGPTDTHEPFSPHHPCPKVAALAHWSIAPLAMA